MYGAGKKEEVQYLGYQCSTQEGMYFTQVLFEKGVNAEAGRFWELADGTLVWGWADTVGIVGINTSNDKNLKLACGALKLKKGQ